MIPPKIALTQKHLRRQNTLYSDDDDLELADDGLEESVELLDELLDEEFVELESRELDDATAVVSRFTFG